MATRLYLPRWDGRATPVSTAAGTQWNQTANSFSAATGVLAATTKGATAPTATTSANFTKSSATTPWNTLQLQAVSDTLDVAQTVSGTFSAVFRMGETSTAANISLQVVLRVVSQDGATERGVLYAGHAAANNATSGALGQEAPTTAATRVIPAGTALSSVSAQPGDRIVVEVGTRAETTGTTTAGFIQFGDNTGTADHTFGVGSTSSLVPWVELTQDLTFGTPVGDVVIDDFNDNSISAGWTNWTGTNIAETGGQLELTTSTTAFAYFGLQRVAAETITGAFLGTKVVSAGNQSLLGYGAYPVSLVFSSGYEAYWIITAGTAFAYTALSGSYVQRGSVTHADGRTYVVGESAGDIVWKYSDDLASWTTSATLADPFSGDQTVSPYIMVGTDQANGSTTTFVVDDFGWYDTTGVTPVSGTIATTLGALTATATGLRETPGTVATTLGGLTAAAAGIRETSGSITSTLGALAASSAGTRTVVATAASTLGGLTAAASGTRETPGSAVATLGGLTASAVGVRTAPGAIATTLGALSATAAGTRTTPGSITSTFGALTATATAVREVGGTVATTLGGLTATAVGSVSGSPTGTIATILGALTATATGLRTVPATATGSLGALTATITGVRGTSGQAGTTFGALDASAVAVVVRLGVIATDLGGLTATAVGTSAPFDATTPRPSTVATVRPGTAATSLPSSAGTVRPSGTATSRPFAEATPRP